MAHWNWAVWAILASYIFGIWIAADKHGEPKGDHDVKVTIIGSVIGIWLLWCGGFFS